MPEQPTPGGTARGRATRARLLQGTRDVVAEVGYAHATTKAIAQAAGVAEGTIYRHFPDKISLFLAAATEAGEPVLESLSHLPARAGTGTVAGNLAQTLTSLASLREQVLPLEAAMLTDPELSAQRARALAPAAASDKYAPPRPHDAIAEYLAAEQHLGRVRADLDPQSAAVTILSALFGLALMPAAEATQSSIVAKLVDVMMRGLAP